MSYVFDNSPLSALFRNYYRKTFPSLWHRFDQLVDDGRLVSTREVFREIEDGPSETLLEWAKNIARCLRRRRLKKALSSPRSMPFRTSSRTLSKRSYCAAGGWPILS